MRKGLVGSWATDLAIFDVKQTSRCCSNGGSSASKKTKLIDRCGLTCDSVAVVLGFKKLDDIL